MLIGKLYGRYVTFVCRAPRAAASVVLLLCIWPALQTVRMFTTVKADLQELLPRDSDAAKALDIVHARVPSQGHITVVAHGKSPPSNRAFIDALAVNLRKAQSPLVAWVQADVRDERAWLKLRAPLLMTADRFDGLMNDVDSFITSAKARANPLFVPLDDDDDKDDGWQALRERLNVEVRAKDRFPRGYLETVEGEAVIAIVWLRGSDVDIDTARALKKAVAVQVDRTLASFAPAVQVAYTGDAANFIEEHDAVIEDLSLTSLVVLFLVTGLIAIYFRSLRSVVVVLATLVPGLLVTFGLGRLLVGHLNSNTAFLGSIIAGNGINYPLVFLSFYRRRDINEPLPMAVIGAGVAGLPGTLGAAATASAAYAGLAASGFRGFSQFGYLGGLGMIATWALTYLTAPIAIAWLRPARMGTVSTRTEVGLRRFFATPWLAKGVALAFLGAVAAVAGVGLLRAKSDGVYEMRLGVLRNRRSISSGSASWDPTMNRLFGSWVNPVVALVDDPSHRETAAQSFRGLSVGRPALVDRVDTIETFVPSAAEQSRRLADLQRLRSRIDQLPPEELHADVAEYLTLWMSPQALRPVTLPEVPGPLLRNIRERDGTVDKTILIYPSTKIDYDDGHNMIALAKAVGNVTLPGDAVVGGPFLFMASLFELVHAEAPRVVLIVFLLVIVLLIPLYRKKPSRILLSALVIGPVALFAQAMVLAAGIRINMLNFAAVPITIGVGADYLLNLFGAMDGLALDARAACARMGGAILLCSLTTTVGYGSLLMAYSGALRSFGWAAVVGELVAVATVLLVVPAFSPTANARSNPRQA